MPRRSDHTRSEFIELVTTAAEALVAEPGDERLSARAIARRIGYSPGSIYLAFDNLDDVILHVNARTLERLHACIADSIADETDALTQVKQAARAYITFARNNPDLWRLCFEHAQPADRPTPEWLDRRIEALVELILEPLARAGGQASEPLTAAQALWAGIHGICILTLTGKLQLVGKQTTESLTDALVSNYLRGAAQSSPGRHGCG